LDALRVHLKARITVFFLLRTAARPSHNHEAANFCHPILMNNDDTLESLERVKCPGCGKPFTLPRMNVCYIARQDCPHCGASILIEGDKVTAEAQSRDS
jgi:hypothetical protein